MDDRANRSFIDAKAERDSAHQNAHFIRHPAFLIFSAHVVIHFSMIRNGRNSMLLEEINRFFHLVNGRRINNYILFRVGAQGLQQKIWLFASAAFLDDVTQVRTVKTRDVFVGIAQLKLVNNIVTHSLSRTRGESCNGLFRKIGAQRAHLSVLRPEFVAPFRNAVRLVNHKKRNRHVAKPLDSVGAREALRRKIEKAVSPFDRFAHDLGLLRCRYRAVQQCCGDSHLRELRHLVLHQRDQGRNDDYGLLGEICRRPSASPRRCRAFAASFERFSLVAGETSRNPSNGAAQAGDPFPHSRKQYSSFEALPKAANGFTMLCSMPSISFAARTEVFLWMQKVRKLPTTTASFCATLSRPLPTAVRKRCAEPRAHSRNFMPTNLAGHRAKYWRTSAMSMIGRSRKRRARKNGTFLSLLLGTAK